MEARFLSYVEKTETCWLWTGGKNKTGYSAFNIDNHMHSGHRVAYELWVAKIPSGLVIRHKCKNKHCVNPEHLETGTHKENSQDKWRDNTMHKAKLTAEQVRDIRSRVGQTARELANEFGVHQTTISHIISKTTWSHIDNETHSFH
jgi:hypothetical protein